MRQIITWVEHAAGVKGRKSRQRTNKWTWMRLSTPVGIGEDERLSEPEALVVSYERFATDRAPRTKETVRRVTPGHEGSLWRGLQDGRGRPLTAEALADAEASRGTTFWPFAKPFGRDGGLLEPESIVMATMASIEIDGRPVQRARVAKTAESLCDVSGELWRKDTEPTWIVGLEAGRAVLDYGRGYSGKEMPGIRIRIDRREDAEAMARAIGTTGKPKLSKMRVEKADPRFLSAESIPASIKALTSAVWAIRREARISPYMPSLSLADEALKAAWVFGSDWKDVAARLAEFADLVSHRERGYQREHWKSAHIDYRALGYEWSQIITTAVDAGLFPRQVGETAVIEQDNDESLADLGM